MGGVGEINGSVYSCIKKAEKLMLTFVSSYSQSKNICRMVVRGTGGKGSIPLLIYFKGMAGHGGDECIEPL